MQLYMTRRRFVGSLAALGLATTRSSVHAQAASYPSKPVKLILPFPGGAITSPIGQIVCTKLQAHFGQPFVPDYRPGASGMIGMSAVAKAAPDGYTMLFGTTAIVQNSTIFKSVPYDPFTDFEPVCRLATSAQVLVTGANSPFDSLDGYIRFVKSRASSFGSIGVGTTSHLYGQLLAQSVGAVQLHVPYKTESQELVELISGDVAGAFLTIGTALPQWKGGRLKVLACTGAKRSSLIPDVPTLSELGYKGFETVGWSALFFPSKVPPSIIEAIAFETNNILKEPEVMLRIADTGFEATGSTPAELTRIMHTDFAVWSDLVKRNSIEPI